MGILDQIISSKQIDTKSVFKPNSLAELVISNLSDRDKNIIIFRHGLFGNETKTLAAIGTEHKLTRERVRQIEKDLLKTLRKTAGKIEDFMSAKSYILNIIHEHGKIISENALLEYLNLENEAEKKSAVFLLYLIEEVENYIHENYKNCWVSVLFNPAILKDFSATSHEILETHAKPLNPNDFYEKISQTDFFKSHGDFFTQKVVLNFLDIAHKIEKNVFGHWGMSHWKEITPKDVGDKAYLVLKAHGKPEHYGEITNLINSHKFDSRKAFKETVHNELIKDKRFVLVGRGIYALAEWGYKPGVVMDVIKEVLQKAGKPLSKKQIIEEVLKMRVVKKNTITVGLSNKKYFRKVGRDLYEIAIAQ